MRILALRFALTFLLLSIVRFLDAQIAADSLPADSTYRHSLSELVVTAQRQATPRFGTPEAIETTHENDIRSRQFRTAPEALSATAGVFVQKTNHGGGSPFLRGLTGNQTLLLVDGIRLSNATFRYGPNQYFNTLDVFSMGRIEVLRGGGSVQYGSDALGGAVQAFSRDAVFSEKPDWSGEVLLCGASQGMEKSARAGMQYASKRAAFLGGLTWRDFGDLIGGDTTGKQSPGGYKEFDFDLKGKIALSSPTTLTVAHQNVRQSHVPVFHKVQLEDFAVNEFDPQHRTLTYARLEHSMNRGVWQSLSVTASLQQSEEGRRSRKNGSPVLRYENDRVRSLGFIAQINNTFGQHWSASSGIETYNDLVNSARTDTDQNTGVSSEKRGLYPDGAAMTNIAAFTLHAFDFPEWHFSAGARWNSFIVDVEDEAIGSARLTPSALVSNAAVMRKLGAYSRLFVSVNTAFRAPNIDDLGTLGIVDFRFETPNYDLRPEHSVNCQIGYKLLKNRLQGEIYFYRNELRDLITRVKQDTQTMQGYPLYQKENVEQAYIQGVETAWTFTFACDWSAQGSLTYTYGQNMTQREPVRRIPPLFGRLALDYAPGTWLFGAEWLAAGKQDRLAKGDTEDNRIPKGGTPGWSVLNFHAGYEWRFLSLRLSGLNLFNEDYRTHGSGVNGYGRSVFATFAIQW
ncbi:MAG: Vitamin B12 transporter BtuB [Saprospiraceae bacterium]|nr:Vitamin B12 transporter BtuB [Saprospiraceae bacterium]